MKKRIFDFCATLARRSARCVGLIPCLIRRRRRARRLVGESPSILSNDCVGGVMTHELRRPFCSPTVNLYFESHDGFLSYVEDIAYYTASELKACGSGLGAASGREYPIGVLCGDERHSDVRIHFLHYHTFEEAYKKWETRTRRICPERIAVVLHADVIDERIMERFAALPYAKKVVIAYEPSISPFVYTLRFLTDFNAGRLLRFKGCTGRRYLDEFDYAAFLNEGVIRPYGQK